MPIFINSCDSAFAAFLIAEGVAASRLKLLYTALQPSAQAGETSRHATPFSKRFDILVLISVSGKWNHNNV